MKPVFQILAAAALLTLGACSTAVDSGPGAGLDRIVTNAGPIAQPGVPQFAAASTALPALLARGASKVTYIARAERPIIGSAVGNCPYAVAQRSGVYTAYRFTDY